MPLRIVLIHPEIPPNTGNIARLCVAINCELHLVKPLGFSIHDKYLKRAGLDYWHYLNLVLHESLDDFLKQLKGDFYFFSSKGKKPYTSIKFSKDDWLIFGSETSGFPEIIFDKFSERIYTIPMFGPVRCLNLSNSVAIVAYEAMRQVENF
ncbi:MAG: tRNA (cytidine(34)-2'-O)-methyltransferase [Proteobacteria bacterium]|nr:tRNA (cytidine(34)-2'-O)-methyltransferase [Pseudomonadota bacterium]